MRLLDISLYPVHQRKAVGALRLLCIITALEAIATLIWFMAHPSEPESRDFMFYSLERWGLILFTCVLVVFFVFLLWSIESRHGWISRVIQHFEGEERVAGLLLFITVISIGTLLLYAGLFSAESTLVYYRQILPLLSLITLIIGQVWVFLLVSLRTSPKRILEIWFPIYPENQSLIITKSKRLLAVMIGISIAYIIVQISAGIKVQQAVELGDTTSYLEGAAFSLSDPAFFSERRPWGILLIYKLLGGSLTAIGIAQLSFSTFAWLFLAWMLVRSLSSDPGKILGSVVVLGVSLSPTVQSWNFAGLSESFSISTLIVILALFIGILQRWKWSLFLALILFFAIWVSIHEANLYLGLLTASFLFIIGIIRKNFRTFLILSFCIAVMLGINSRLSSFYGLPRWALPVAEVITMRILPVPEYQEYFINQGMPVSPELMALNGRWAHSDNFAIINNPRMRPFSKWLFQEGKTVYTNFLVSHPVYTLSMPLVNIEEMLAADFSQLIPGYEPALPAIINELFFPIRWFWAYLGLSLLIIATVIWRQRREKSRLYWLLVLFFVFSIPYLYLAWHADALDLERHATIANMQFHLGLWLLVVFYLDKELPSLSNKNFLSRNHLEIGQDLEDGKQVGVKL
jgi:hypothetical protein